MTQYISTAHPGTAIQATNVKPAVPTSSVMKSVPTTGRRVSQLSRDYNITITHHAQWGIYWDCRGLHAGIVYVLYIFDKVLKYLENLP